MRQSSRIRDFILQNVEEHPDSISRMTSKEFGISRQAVNRHLNTLLSQGLLSAKGSTRSRAYELRPIIEHRFPITISLDLDDDRVWRQYLAALFEGFRQNIVGIGHYGFTEMYNNVIDHSEGKNAVVSFRHVPGRVELTVKDDGIGIFNKITKELGLADERQAILELAKGKVTTDPKNHTGEGIFFATRMFDTFSILSGRLFYCRSIHMSGEWLLEDREDVSKGTFISMKIGTDSDRTLKEIFDQYSSEEDEYGFRRTLVPVSLATYGRENLVSRSQAKRVLARFDLFDEVLLDFVGVAFIGQAFADEIFRVFRNNNPDKKINWIHANDAVETTIRGVISST